MTKASLITEINAFAAAKTTGNETLILRQGELLQGLLATLPDELVEKEEPKPAPEKQAAAIAAARKALA